MAPKTPKPGSIRVSREIGVADGVLVFVAAVAFAVVVGVSVMVVGSTDVNMRVFWPATDVIVVVKLLVVTDRDELADWVALAEGVLCACTNMVSGAHERKTQSVASTGCRLAGSLIFALGREEEE